MFTISCLHIDKIKQNTPHTKMYTSHSYLELLRKKYNLKKAFDILRQSQHFMVNHFMKLFIVLRMLVLHFYVKSICLVGFKESRCEKLTAVTDFSLHFIRQLYYILYLNFTF